MPNTNLPTALAPGSTDHINNHKVIHEELNRMTRDTGLRDCSTLLVNGWKLSGSTPYIRVRSRGGLVTLYFRGLDGSSATAPEFLKFGTAAVEEGEPRIAAGFRVSNEVSNVVSFKSAAHFDDQGALFGIEVTAAAIRSSAALPNSRRNLGVYERTIEWESLAWPAFLPPAAA